MKMKSDLFGACLLSQRAPGSAGVNTGHAQVNAGSYTSSGSLQCPGLEAHSPLPGWQSCSLLSYPNFTVCSAFLEESGD